MSSSLSEGGAVTLDLPTAEPSTYVLVGVLLAAVALVASFLPARRAARVSPVVALRHEA